MAGLLSLLAGASRAGIAADTGRNVGLAQRGEVERRSLLDQLKQQREAEDFDLRRQLAEAQMANYRSLAEDREKGTLEYDPVRGAIVDVRAGTARVPSGLPGRPEMGGGAGSFKQYVDPEGNAFEFNPATGETRRPPAGLKPAGAAGDRNTAVVRKEVAANKSNLAVIDDALAELARYPNAVGLARGVGKLPFMGNVADVINQRTDPEGVNARSAMANIGSLIIHDRSGAAVSIHEFPRLAPFIPDVSDTYETAVKKLNKLREAIALETGELEKGTLLVNPQTLAPPTPPSGPADLTPFLPPPRRRP